MEQGPLCLLSFYTWNCSKLLLKASRDFLFWHKVSLVLKNEVINFAVKGQRDCHLTRLVKGQPHCDFKMFCKTLSSGCHPTPRLSRRTGDCDHVSHLAGYWSGDTNREWQCIKIPHSHFYVFDSDRRGNKPQLDRSAVSEKVNHHNSSIITAYIFYICALWAFLQIYCMFHQVHCILGIF